MIKYLTNKKQITNNQIFDAIIKENFLTNRCNLIYNLKKLLIKRMNICSTS